MVILMISGVAVLLVNSISTRTKSFDRTKATELGQKVIESIIHDKTMDPVAFWKNTYWNKYVANMTDSAFPNYQYTVTNQQINSGSCGGGYNCVEATITVGWSATSDIVIIKRLFTKY